MPGVNHPVSERVFAMFGEMRSQIRALATQQNLTFTNANGEVVAGTGTFGDGSGHSGLAGYDGANGTRVFGVYDTTIPDGSGRRQTNVDLLRDDGTAALVLSDLGTVPNHPHEQALQWFDRSGNVVVADDTDSGTGVARPHIPFTGMINTNVATWPGTNSATVTTIASCVAEFQQPKLAWYVMTYAPAGVTGVYSLKVNSTQIATFTNSGATFQWWSGTAVMPSGLTFGSMYEVDLTAKVTAGTGTVSAAVYALQGQGT